MAFPSPDNWKPGIYFGLPEETYHSLPWLGSSDVKKLATIPQDYWEGSAMNELRDLSEEPADSAAKLFGRAVHTCILHGEPEYLKRYGYIENDTNNKEGPSAEGLKQWIRAQGAEPRKLKDDNLRYIKETWSMEMVTERQNRQILMAARSIKSNPYLAQAFSNGFPEVSIFWTDSETGAPCKARIDYLKIAASVDLKSIRSRPGEYLAFHQMCLRAIFRSYRYDIQACHYTAARIAARQLLEEGAVFGAVFPAEDWLRRCLFTDPGFVFVFYKANGAPIAQAIQGNYGGWMLTSGIADRQRALANYSDFMERFGTSIWVDTSEPWQADSEDDAKWWNL